MKKAMSLLLSVILVFSLAACSGSGQTLKGEAEGYGGKITATVTKEGDKITNLEVDAPDETKEIGGDAVKEITAKILEKGSTDGVELVSGATVTSEAVLEAVNSAK